MRDEAVFVSDPVLLLSRSDVVKILDPRALVDRLADAFKIHSSRETEESLPSNEFDMGSGILSTSRVATMNGIPAYAVKIESRIPGKNPAITGLLQLYGADGGNLLAVMESSHISNLASALTGALASDLLAVPEATSVAVVGNGTQGWLGLRFLMEMRPLERVTLFDLNRRKSRRMAERLKKYEGLDVAICDSLNEAVCHSDIIYSATWSQRPFLFSEMIKPGAHICTLGSDGIGKRELSRELLETCSFYCDDRDLAVSVGALSDLLDGSKLVKAELGEILGGQKTGRRDDEDITVYAPVGLPFIDLIAAWETYCRARRKKSGKAFRVFD